MLETNPNPNQKRNKIILFAALALVLVCLITCAVGYFGLRKAATDVIKLDPAQARALALQITDYELPAGYKEIGGLSVFGVVSAGISDTKNMIWLVQAPTDNLPTPEKFLHDTYQNKESIDWTVNDIKIVSIRGAKSTLTLYDGADQAGKTYHAWTGKFTGEGGPALVLIVGPAESWNEQVADAFLKSMR